MGIYLGTKKVKNVYLGTSKVKRIWVGTELVYNSNVATIGDTITVSGSIVVYSDSSNISLTQSAISGEGLSLSADGKSVVNNGSTEVTVSISGNWVLAFSNDGGAQNSYMASLTIIAGSTVNVFSKYNNEGGSGSISNTVKIPAGGSLSFEFRREYDGNHQTCSVSNVVIKITAI